MIASRSNSARMLFHRAITKNSVRRFHLNTQHRFVDVNNPEEPQIDSEKIDIHKYKSFKPTLVYRNTEIDVDTMPNEKMNLCTALNDAMKISMKEDETVSVFGEDVAFGGVFRCTVDLLEMFGKGMNLNVFFFVKKERNDDEMTHFPHCTLIQTECSTPLSVSRGLQGSRLAWLLWDTSPSQRCR